MKKRIAAPAALLLIGAAVAAVFVYNTWSYCCGRCSVSTFLTPGPYGLALIGLNLLAASTLAVLKLRRRARRAVRRCRCGADLIEGWVFCPICGQAAHRPRA